MPVALSVLLKLAVLAVSIKMACELYEAYRSWSNAGKRASAIRIVVRREIIRGTVAALRITRSVSDPAERAAVRADLRARIERVRLRAFNRPADTTPAHGHAAAGSAGIAPPPTGLRPERLSQDCVAGGPLSFFSQYSHIFRQLVKPRRRPLSSLATAGLPAPPEGVWE